MGKKVGIMSMQRILNYGSFLQAYGLKSMLEEMGCSVRFVDYHPGETLIPAAGGKGFSRKLFKLVEVFRYKAPFKEKVRFLRYKKNYAAKNYPYLEMDSRRNYATDLDLLIIGSDEVFNCVQSNPNVGFSPELFGEGSRAGKLISYAASFGNTTEVKLRQYGMADRVGMWLKKFDALSVRDANSGSIVEALSGRSPEYHLDPVLVYDFLGKCSEIPRKVPETDYLLLYGYSGRFSQEECRAVRAYAEKKKLQIFCIGGVQQCCNKFIDCSPFEVIAYFQHASCAVTDTFHGTILSVITHQNFVAFVREEGYGNCEKLTDLLERLELTDRMLKVGERLATLENLLDRPVDYTRTDGIIAEERNRAERYLKSASS